MDTAITSLFSTLSPGLALAALGLASFTLLAFTWLVARHRGGAKLGSFELRFEREGDACEKREP